MLEIFAQKEVAVATIAAFASVTAAVIGTTSAIVVVLQQRRTQKEAETLKASLQVDNERRTLKRALIKDKADNIRKALLSLQKMRELLYETAGPNARLMTLLEAQKEFSTLLDEIQDCYQTMYASDNADYVARLHEVKTSISAAREILWRTSKKMSRASELNDADRVLLMSIRDSIKSLQDHLRIRHMEVLEDYLL